ncbi:MAG: hypothetical protein H5U36_09060 [Candidatus Caldatribacterium sp.]|nr:hypothetical protein [Candidatus Caldatribacterium sp.]
MPKVVPLRCPDSFRALLELFLNISSSTYSYKVLHYAVFPTCAGVFNVYRVCLQALFGSW